MLNKKTNKFLTSKTLNFIVMTMIFSLFIFVMPCFCAGGADALTSARDLLSKGATAGGGLWAVWGLVQLGMSVKDHNGPGIQGAIWQIIGGGIIIAAATIIGTIDLSMA